MKKNNTIYIKKSNLDQFYTSKEIAIKCYQEIIDKYDSKRFSVFLEPSAGAGSFFNLFPKSKRYGIDLEIRNVMG